MIDVHILTRPTDNKIWFDECLKSLENENINLFIEPGIEGNVGLARYNAFKKGNSEFVSYVDPDDMIVPGIFSKMLEKMTDECCGVFTNEITIHERNNKIIKKYRKLDKWKRFSLRESVYPHHICLMKRNLIEKYSYEFLDWKYRSEYIIKNVMTLDFPWIQMDDFGYEWRIHSNCTHVIHTEINPKVVEYIKNIFEDANSKNKEEYR